MTACFVFLVEGYQIPLHFYVQSFFWVLAKGQQKYEQKIPACRQVTKHLYPFLIVIKLMKYTANETKIK